MRLGDLRRLAPLAAALLLSAAVAGCSMGSGMAFSTTRTQGYEISDDALLQVRPGQSRELVQMVLGSPGATNWFGDETAWYYIETKVDQTAFGLTTIKERTVLAVYFDTKGKVTDKAVYGAQDGKLITIESRRTPSFGKDRTFLEALVDSI